MLGMLGMCARTPISYLLYPIANKLGIKYLTWMNKNEIIDEINRVENGGILKKSNKYMCEHNKQKYKCILCDGLHICEHKKQKPACTACSKPKICQVK